MLDFPCGNKRIRKAIYPFFKLIFISRDVLLRMFIMNLWLVSYKQHKVEVCSMYQGESLGFLGGLGVTNNGTAVETIIIVFVWFF